MSQTLPPWTALLHMICGSWVSQSLSAAAQLKLADHLTSGPKSVDELAAVCGANPGTLFRLMRALAALGVFSQPSPGTFGLTPIGECLREGAPNSLREFAIAEQDHPHWAAWERCVDAVRSGKPIAREVLGMDQWGWYGTHPEDSACFSAAMGNLSNIVTPAVLDAYDFSRASKIIDVAGAHGVFLAEILTRYPQATGILFDLPHVIAESRAVLEKHGVADRVESIAGDMFKEVPAGGDVYLLKHIIHNWDDERATAILRACRAAMKPNGKVLIVELIVPPDNELTFAQLMDMNMLVMLTGKERSEAEYQTLLAGAQLRLERVHPAKGTPYGVVEACAA